MHVRPILGEPTLLLAFEGWNDACEVSTSAARFVNEALRSVPLAEIDPDDYFVFTEQRPTVRLIEGQTREIKWPSMNFTPMPREESDHDFILALGTEPHLKWKAFAADLLEYARTMQVEEIVTLGALLADTPHTRPVPLSGGASDPARAAELGFTGSRYEGPTGIVGALHDSWRGALLPAASLWVGLPPYLGEATNPRGALALLQELDKLFAFAPDLSALVEKTQGFEEQVDAALANNPELKKYLGELEKRVDSGIVEAGTPDVPPAGDLFSDLDAYLRQQRQDG